jgi:hypothetical protein
LIAIRCRAVTRNWSAGTTNNWGRTADRC